MKELRLLMDIDDNIQHDFAHAYLLPARPVRQERQCLKIIHCLNEDFRMTLTDMSKKTKIPISTIFDNLKLLRRHYNFNVVISPVNERGDTNE